MSTVQEIYDEYQVMPGLQMHQLRVAAVARLICRHFNGKLDESAVTAACLFHDMGNIIKSDLARFPEFLEPKGIAYWAEVKERYIQRYGDDANEANIAIARQLGLSPAAFECLQRIGFRNIRRNHADGSFEAKICNYADMRVGPHGVISIDERVAEGRKRYEGKKHTIVGAEYEESIAALRDMERDIFVRTDIVPSYIDDRKIEPLIAELRELLV